MHRSISALLLVVALCTLASRCSADWVVTTTYSPNSPCDVAHATSSEAALAGVATCRQSFGQSYSYTTCNCSDPSVNVTTVDCSDIACSVNCLPRRSEAQFSCQAMDQSGNLADLTCSCSAPTITLGFQLQIYQDAQCATELDRTSNVLGSCVSMGHHGHNGGGYLTYTLSSGVVSVQMCSDPQCSQNCRSYISYTANGACQQMQGQAPAPSGYYIATTGSGTGGTTSGGPNSSPGKAPMPPGELAGIIIGCVVVATLIVIGIVFGVRRYRRTQYEGIN